MAALAELHCARVPPRHFQHLPQHPGSHAAAVPRGLPGAILLHVTCAAILRFQRSLQSTVARRRTALWGDGSLPVSSQERFEIASRILPRSGIGYRKNQEDPKDHPGSPAAGYQRSYPLLGLQNEVLSRITNRGRDHEPLPQSCPPAGFLHHRIIEPRTGYRLSGLFRRPA